MKTNFYRCTELENESFSLKFVGMKRNSKLHHGVENIQDEAELL